MNDSGYLDMKDDHEIYFEDHGPKEETPILFVHGGPGAGFFPSDLELFNLNTQRVVFFDQRGAGKSKPHGLIENNTTNHLIEDMRSLLRYLNIDKCILFGGSWGSTLSLSFAIRHSSIVLGMVLRGIFLGTEKENRHMFIDGSDRIFPEVYERFLSFVPENQRKDPLAFYAKQLSNSKIAKEQFDLLCREFTRYEFSLAKLNYQPEKIDGFLNSFNFQSMAKIESYYLNNKCFIEEDYIINHIKSIEDIPTAIVQGRYDAITVPKIAYSLAKKLKNCKLKFVIAGHSATEVETSKELKKATQWVINQI